MQKEIKQKYSALIRSLSNVLLASVFIFAAFGLIIAYRYEEIGYFRILVFTGGLILGNLIVLGHVAWEDGGKKLLTTARATSWIALFFLVSGIGNMGSEPIALIFAIPLFMFSLLFAVSILAIFGEKTLPVTDELAIQLFGVYLLWNTGTTISLSHPLFIIGSLLFLVYFFFASKKQAFGTTMRGVSVFTIITYLFVSFSYQAVEVIKTFKSGVESSSMISDYWLMFTLGIFMSYILLYGLRVFEVVLKISPVRLFFLSSKLSVDTLRGTMERYSNSFSQRQYKISNSIFWIMLLLASLYTNMIFGQFLSPLTITVFTIILATYRPQQPVVIHS